VKISYDPTKNEHNIRNRGLSFDAAKAFDFETALIEIDTRVEYGEVRYVALGKLDDRLHVLCFTETEVGIRVISFRKANLREVNRYAKTQTTDR
jgi:uncharacterized protein